MLQAHCCGHFDAHHRNNKTPAAQQTVNTCVRIIKKSTHLLNCFRLRKCNPQNMYPQKCPKRRWLLLECCTKFDKRTIEIFLSDTAHVKCTLEMLFTTRGNAKWAEKRQIRVYYCFGDAAVVKAAAL